MYSTCEMNHEFIFIYDKWDDISKKIKNLGKKKTTSVRQTNTARNSLQITD